MIGLRNVRRPPPSPLSSWPLFYPEEEGGAERQAGVSAGGGVCVCVCTVGEGLLVSGRKWRLMIMKATLLTTPQAQLCVCLGGGGGGGNVWAGQCILSRVCVCVCW